MHRKRFLPDAEAIRLPQPPPAPITPNGFLWVAGLFPPQTQDQWLWQQWIYQSAFETAQAVVRPSLPERDLLAVWN
jgi:hypothetical protein